MRAKPKKLTSRRPRTRKREAARQERKRAMRSHKFKRKEEGK